MTKTCFENCIQGLNLLSPRTLPADAARIFWNRLTEHGIHDDDLREASCYLTDHHHFRNFPTLAEILEACRKAQTERLQKEHQALKQDEEKYRYLSQEQMLSRGKGRSKEAQAAIANAKALLAGKINTPTWLAAQKIIATDDKSQAELHRMETRMIVRGA